MDEGQKIQQILRRSTNRVKVRRAQVVLASEQGYKTPAINDGGIDAITWYPYYCTRAGPRKFFSDVVEQICEVALSVDYLTTRPDIDIQKLTYCGFSWGSCISPIMLTVEDRTRFAILFSGGFVPEFTNTLPQANPINFAPRVRCDLLMINGINDLLIPFKTSQKPMFDMLGRLYKGTDNQIDKKHMPYPCGHGSFFILPDTPDTNVREYILSWMDDHLGPVD